MSRNKLYLVVTVIFLAGLSWLAVSVWLPEFSGFGICIFKQVTGIPCPSCGVTRAIVLLASGELRESVLMNPLGIVIAPLLILIPCWILLDVVKRNNSFFLWYGRAEKIIRKPAVATVFVVLLLLNWAWGISKGL